MIDSRDTATPTAHLNAGLAGRVIVILCFLALLPGATTSADPAPNLREARQDSAAKDTEPAAGAVTEQRNPPDESPLMTAVREHLTDTVKVLPTPPAPISQRMCSWM